MFVKRRKARQNGIKKWLDCVRVELGTTLETFRGIEIKHRNIIVVITRPDILKTRIMNKALLL